MRTVERGVLFGFLVLAIASSTAWGQERARFSRAPVVENRKVTLEWEPVAGRDPYFQGNTILDDLGINPGPVSGQPLRLLTANTPGDKLYGIYEGDARIHIWSPDTPQNETVLDAPPDSITSFDVHGTGRLILAGLRDGRVAFWNLDEGTFPQVYQAHAARVRAVQFVGLGLDLTEQSFVSIADEATFRIWAAPGNLLAEQTIAGTVPTAVEVSSDASTILVGDRTGAIRVYRLLQGSWRVDRRLDGHTAPVTGIVMNRNRNLFFSIDRVGRLFGWSGVSWTENFSLQLDRQESALLGVRDPDGSLVYTLDRVGYFQIFDGPAGRLYRTGDLLAGAGSQIHASNFANGGRVVYVGLPNGSIHGFRTGFCEPSEDNPTCFGGYMLWRSTTPRPEDAVQLRVFGFGDSTWSFVEDVRMFTDPDSLIPRGEEDPANAVLAGPHNGMPYYYSITDFNRVYLNGTISDVGWDYRSIYDGFYRLDPNGPPTPIQAHPAAVTDDEGGSFLGQVKVVPNPYEAGKVPWDGGLGPHVDFIGLPERATIRIYTVAGDHLRTIEHGSGAFGESSDREPWDLRNASGEDVASGVYIYFITTPLSSQEAKGYFIVVR